MTLSPIPAISAFAPRVDAPVDRSSHQDFQNLFREIDQQFARFSQPQKETQAAGQSFGLGELEQLAKSAQSFQLSTSRSEFSVLGDGYQAQGVSEKASFEATFQQGDSLLKLSVKIERTVVGIAYGSASRQEDGNAGLSDVLQKLLDDLSGGNESPALGFTPESGADAISQAILDIFRKADGADGDHRDAVADSVNEGFRRALDLLGNLPASIAQDIEKTRTLVDHFLQTFAPEIESSPAQTTT